MSEVWKGVPGWEGFYEVSDQGYVHSLAFVYRDSIGRTYTNTPTILKPAKATDGAWCVGLHRAGKQITKSVARLVLEAFVGPCPEGMEACHFPDRDTLNNRLANLRWDSRSSNQQDRVFHGTDNRGEKCGMAKLKVEEVLAIRRLYQTGKLSTRKLAKWFGVGSTTIRAIINKKTWSYV